MQYYGIPFLLGNRRGSVGAQKMGLYYSKRDFARTIVEDDGGG